MAITQTDDLGLTKEENLQIDALSMGASPEEVASVSRQKVSDIPTYVPSAYAEEDPYLTTESLYTPQTPPMPKKKAADMALFASLADKEEGEITTKYKGMYDQLRTSGNSALYDNIKKSVRDKEISALEDDIFSVAREGNVEAAQTLLEASDALVNERASMRRAGLESATESFLDNSPADIRTQQHAEDFLSSLGSNVTPDGRSLTEILDEQIDAEIRSSTDDGLELTSDLVISAFTGEQLAGLANVGKDIFGERYNFLGGTLMRDLAQKYRSLPDNEKEEFSQAVVDSIARHSGVSVYGDDAQYRNDIIKVFALETFREFAKTPGGDIPFDRWLADVFGTVEAAGLVPVAGIARLLSRINKIRKSPSSLAKNNPARNEVQSANPELDAILSAEGIKREEIADELGTSQTAELERAYFSNKIDEDTYLVGAPNSVVEKIQGLNTISDEVRKFTDNTYLFHDKEYIAKQERLISVFSDEKTIGKVKPSFSTMERDPNTNNIIVDAIFGNELDIPLDYVTAGKLAKNLRALAEEEGIPITSKSIQIIAKNSDLEVFESTPSNPFVITEVVPHKNVSLGETQDVVGRYFTVNGKPLFYQNNIADPNSLTRIGNEVKKLVNKLPENTQLKEEDLTKIIISEAREELLPIAGNKLSRGEVKKLTAEKRDIEIKLSKVAPITEDELKNELKNLKSLDKKGKARAQKKQAKENITREYEDSIKILEDRIKNIDDKLAKSNIASEAEADLSRLDQGIIPNKYQKVLEKILLEQKNNLEINEENISKLIDQEKNISVKDTEKAVDSYKKRISLSPVKNRPISQGVPDIDTGTQYLVKMKVKAPMYYEDILGVDKANQTKSAGGELLGPLSRSWANAQNYLDRTLMGGSRVALAQKFNVRQELLRIANPFFALSYPGQKRVAGLLKDGEEWKHVDEFGKPTGEVGKTFTYNELKGRYTAKEIEGYFAARVLNDTIYQIKNTELRERLIRDGYQGLSVRLPGDRYFKNGAKVASTEEVLKGAVRIFDPINNTSIRVTEKKLKELADNGLTVVRLLKKADTSKGKYSFAVVRKDDLHELPKQIYPYREGYNFRVNNDPYFIDRIEKTMVDGRLEDHRTTIGVARSAEEAKRYVDRATEVNNFPSPKSGPVRFASRWDRSLTANDDVLAADHDILDGSGMQYWFSERGARLTRIDDSLSSVEDPIAAIHKMIGAVSNVSTHAKLLETAAIRHRKTFGHITDGDGRKLWDYDPVTQSWHFNKDLASNIPGEDAARALNEYLHLENIKYAPTWVDEKWKDLLERIDIMFGNAPDKFSMASTAITTALAKTTPGRVARGAAFALSIPLRPARHILLQGSTGAHLFGVDPSNVVGSFKDATMLMFGLATYQNPKRWARTVKWAKFFGYSEEEFTEIFEAFRKSGVPFSVDSHVAVGEANFSWARSIPESWAGWGAQKLGQLATLPITAGKMVGFNTGELYNLAVTWSFAKRRYQKLNPGKSWKNQRAIDEITNKGRSYAIDMTKTAQFNYQKGAFAAMTQFLAINHKMLLNILGQDPEIGSIFKKGQRAGHARYLAGLFAMYGTAGFGLHEIYDKWIKEQDVELDPTLDDVLSGGFIQAMFNISLDLAFNKEGELDLPGSLSEANQRRGTTRAAVGASIAPTSGAINFIPDFIESLMDGDMLEALSGPSGQTFKSVYNAANRVSEMWGIRDDLNTPQKVLKSFQTAYMEFGSFSDYAKYNLMMAYKERMDKLYVVGKDGRPTVEANSMQEVWLKYLFGIQTRGEQEFYNEYLNMYRDMHSTGRKEQADYDRDAKHLMKYMYETYAKYGMSVEMTERMKAITFALHNGPDKRYGINVLKSAQNQFKLDPRFDAFVADLAETFAKGMFDSDFNLQEMRNAVRNSDGLPDDSKQRLMDAIDQLDKSRETSRQLMNEYYENY